MCSTPRSDRFYTEAMDAQIAEHLKFLKAVYCTYKAKHRTKTFLIEHWAALMEGSGLMDMLGERLELLRYFVLCYFMLVRKAQRTRGHAG